MQSLSGFQKIIQDNCGKEGAIGLEDPKRGQVGVCRLLVLSKFVPDFLPHDEKVCGHLYLSPTG